jgi:hypothetical protein
MKKSKNIEKPQDHADHHDGIQDRLDRALHWDEVVDQPQQNAHYDQNHHKLKQRHRLLPPYFLDRKLAGPGSCVNTTDCPKIVIAGWSAVESIDGRLYFDRSVRGLFRLGRFASPTPMTS